MRNQIMNRKMLITVLPVFLVSMAFSSCADVTVMELCKVDWKSNSITEVTRDRIEPPGDHTYLEKNWMPILDMPYHFVRWANPLEIVKVHPESLSSEIVISKDNKIKLPLSLLSHGLVIHELLVFSNFRTTSFVFQKVVILI